MNETQIQQFLDCGALIKIAENRILIGWGKRTWIELPDVDFPTFYFPDFFLKEAKPWFVHEHVKEVSIENFLQYIENLEIFEQSIDWQSSEKEIFFEAFQDLQQKFHEQELEKAVPYIFEKAEVYPTQKWIVHMLKNILIKTSDATYPYGFWDGTQGMIGATPELLFNIKKNGSQIKLQTLACAGTAPKDREHPLLKDSKLLHEHEIVVRGIEETLKPLGKINKEKIRVLSLSSLSHLVTPISVEMERLHTFTHIVRTLHPTPALGAYPRNPGLVWLADYQTKMPRGRFGAPVGYYFPFSQEGECFVAIRNVQWLNSEVRIGAGCGVVSQSIFEEEWQEIQLKVKYIKDLLKI